jgi:hypothetical protein
MAGNLEKSRGKSELGSCFSILKKKIKCEFLLPSGKFSNKGWECKNAWYKFFQESNFINKLGKLKEWETKLKMGYLQMCDSLEISQKSLEVASKTSGSLAHNSILTKIFFIIKSKITIPFPPFRKMKKKKSG